MKPARALPPVSLAIALLTASGSAQEQGPTLPTKATAWTQMVEIGIASAEDAVVATGIQYMREFIAAGVKDGEDPRWTNQSFLTEDTFAALPLHFRFLVNPEQKRRPEPLVLLDYEKSIDFNAMFESMDPQPLEGDKALNIRGMTLQEVKRPGGGFRMNFGSRKVFGENPATNELLTTYYDIPAKVDNERLLKRLRQMPIFASFDFRKLMSPRENKEIIGLFGPRAGLLSGSVTKMANRPVVDLYSMMRPGDGLVGGYLAKKAGHARILGSLSFEPGAIFAADLGKQVPRTLLTLIKGAPKDHLEFNEEVRSILEVWNGEINLIASGKSAPKQLDDDTDFGAIMEALGRSLEGTIVLGMEEDTAADVKKDLETFLAKDAVKKSEFGIEAVGEGDRRTFRLGGMAAGAIGAKHISIGANANLLVISIADTAEKSLARRDGTLAKQGTVRTPKKLGLAQGPVKLWVHQGMMRYVGTWYGAIRSFAFGSSVDHRADWGQTALENHLLTENFTLSLSWSSRMGVMLRMMF